MKKYLSFVSLIFISLVAIAQDLTKDDYARAVSFMSSNLQNKKVFNLNIRPNWFADSSGFSFSTQSKEGIVYRKLDFKKSMPELLFDQERLTKLISESFKTDIKSKELQLNSILIHILINQESQEVFLTD